MFRKNLSIKDINLKSLKILFPESRKFKCLAHEGQRSLAAVTASASAIILLAQFGDSPLVVFSFDRERQLPCHVILQQPAVWEKSSIGFLNQNFTHTFIYTYIFYLSPKLVDFTVAVSLCACYGYKLKRTGVLLIGLHNATFKAKVICAA